MWKQGEHLALVGQTGSGKTTLAKELLKLRSYVVAVVTKSDLILWPSSWGRAKRLADIDLSAATKWVFQPEYHQQYGQIRGLLDMVWQQGGWTIYLDELYYIEKQLRLTDEVVRLLTQGRSKYLTVVCGMQRPAWVTRFALSEPVYVISGRLGDKRDVAVVSSVVGSEYVERLQTLRRYQFGLIDKINNKIDVVTKDNIVEVLGGV